MAHRRFRDDVRRGILNDTPRAEGGFLARIRIANIETSHGFNAPLTKFNLRVCFSCSRVKTIFALTRRHAFFVDDTSGEKRVKILISISMSNLPREKT